MTRVSVKGVAVVVLLVGFLLGLALGAAGPVVPSDVEGRAQALRALQASVVLVGDNESRSFCGGTIIGPRRVLTAFHCVRGVGEAGKVRVRPYADKTLLIKTTLGWYRAGWDLATLETAEILPGRVAEFAPDVYPGEAMWLIGSPNVTGESFPFMLTWGRVSLVQVDSWENCPNRGLGSIGTEPHQIITADILAYFGNSGGGGFNNSGQLVGVLVRGEVADDKACDEPDRNFSPAVLWSYLVGPDTMRQVGK